MNSKDHSSEEGSGSTRREMVKKACALAGTTAISSLAGCQGQLIGGGSGEDRGEKLPKLTITGYPPSNTNIHDTLQLIMDNLTEFGFDMEYKGMNRERQLSKIYFEHDYELGSLGYTGRPNRLDPHMLLYKNYHSSQTGNGNYNWSYYENSTADELLDKQATLFDKEERKKVINKIQKLLMQHPAGEMPIEHNQLVNAYNNRKWGGFVEAAGLGLKNIWTWTQVKPKTKDDSMTAAFPLEVPHITPLQANEANQIVNRLVHDRLLRVGKNGQPQPWVAKEMKTSDDNLTITMALRNDITFHDGEKLTAEDVAFTYNYLKKYDNPFFSSAVKPMSEIKATKEYEVKFTLSKPFAPIVLLAFARVYLLPKHIWKNVPDNVGVEKPFQWSPTSSEKYDLIGSGPYTFREWRKGEGIVLRPNNEHPIAAPNVGELFLRSMSNTSAMLTGLKNQGIDFAIRASQINTSALEDAVSNNSYLTMQRTDSVGYDEWAMNTNRTPLDHAAVRAAMSSLIPKETIVQETWDGYAEPAVSPISPVLEYWHNPDVKMWDQENEEGATTHLENGGFVVEDDNIYYGDNNTEPTQDNTWQLGQSRSSSGMNNSSEANNTNQTSQ